MKKLTIEELQEEELLKQEWLNSNLDRINSELETYLIINEDMFKGHQEREYV